MRILKRIIAVFIAVLTAFLLVSKAKAADTESKVPDGSSSDFYDYDDNINRWQDYTYTLDNLESYTQNYSLPPKGKDTKIDKIIPVDCFAKRGTHVHIGEKYGFCVYTTKKKANKNTSEVFIFKITRYLNTNPENLNGEVDYTKANRLTYALFTQFKPVLSNNYTYEYTPSNDSYVIESLQTKNDIAINYANHHICLGADYDFSKQYRNRDWVVLRGKYTGSNEYAYDAIGYGVKIIIDLFCDYLRYFCGLDTVASIVNDSLDDLTDTIVKFLQGEKRDKTVAVLTEELKKSAMRSLGNAGAELNDTLKIIKGMGDVIVDVVEIVMSSPSDITSKISNFVSAANDAIDSVIGAYDLIDKLENREGESNKKSFFKKVLTAFQDISDLASDCICMCMSIWNACHHNNSETISDTLYGKCQCGTSEDNELMIKAEKNNRISFYTHFTFDTDDTWRGQKIKFRTILEFRRAKGKYAMVESRYVISPYDNYDFDKNGEPINKKICYSGYDWEGHTYNITTATYSDMAQYHYVYFKPAFEGTYIFTAQSDDGQNCSFTTSMINGVYRICINTGEIKGNHSINLTVTGLPAMYYLSDTYNCKTTGYYYIKINNNQNKSNVFFEMTSIAYGQVYTFSTYSYTRLMPISFSKIGNQYQVYLESGKTYSISYKCNYNLGLKIS